MIDAPSRLQEGLARILAPTSGGDGIDLVAVQTELDDCLPGTIATVRALELGTLEAWRSWRRFALADGGWLRVLPMDRAARHFFVQLAGPWAQATGGLGLHHVRADALVATAASLLGAVHDVQRQRQPGELSDTLQHFGMDCLGGACSCRLVGGATPAVSVELGRGAVAVVTRAADAATLTMHLQIGPDAWLGEGFSGDDIGAALSAIRTAVGVRMQVDQRIQDDPARAERLLRILHVSDQDLRGGARVLWLSPGTRDYVTTDDSRQPITLPAMTLLDVFANRFRPVATPLYGLRLAPQVEGAEHAYSVAIVTPRGPWIARISLRAMAEVLG